MGFTLDANFSVPVCLFLLIFRHSVHLRRIKVKQKKERKEALFISHWVKGGPGPCPISHRPFIPPLLSTDSIACHATAPHEITGLPPQSTPPKSYSAASMEELVFPQLGVLSLLLARTMCMHMHFLKYLTTKNGLA